MYGISQNQISQFFLTKVGKIFDKYKNADFKPYVSMLIPFFVKTKKNLNSSKLFMNIKQKVYFKKQKFIRRNYISLVLSYGWVQKLPKERRNKMVEEIREILKNEKQAFYLPYKYILLTAQKK